MGNEKAPRKRPARQRPTGQRPVAEGFRFANRSGRRFALVFDETMAAQVRAAALTNNMSFNEQIRTFVQWGLETIADDTDD
jgi:hypothetical protein